MSDLRWLAEIENAIELRGLAANAMRERDTLRDQLAQVTRERDEWVKRAANDENWRTHLTTERDSAIARASTILADRDLAIRRIAELTARAEKAERAEKERDELLAVTRKCPSCEFVYSHTSVHTVQQAERDTAEMIAVLVDEQAVAEGFLMIRAKLRQLAADIRANAWRKEADRG